MTLLLVCFNLLSDCGLVLWFLQNPFVICKLFKKQDVVLPEDAVKSCEVEPAVSSPTEVSEVSLAFPKTEETKPSSDVAESSLAVSGECQSEISAPEVTTSDVC